MPSTRLRANLRFSLGVLAVAAGAAGFAIAFHALLKAVTTHFYGAHDVLSAFRAMPAWQRLLLPAATGAAAGALAMVAARFGRGVGVGDVMEAVVIGQGRISLRATTLKALGAWLAISGGGSVGREGPIIQFGGGLGGALGGWLLLGRERRRILVAAGTAAGFAAAYNTPFAALLFVIEVVTGFSALSAILPALVATVAATALTRHFLGSGPIYGQRAFTQASDVELIAYVALGLVAGLLAPLFLRLLSMGERLFARIELPLFVEAGLGGLLVGALALRLPEVTGNGYESINQILGDGLALPTLLLLLVAKAVATTASVSSGAPGGVFTPTLLMGACVGGALGHGAAAVLPLSAPPAAYALVGMAAFCGATTHAPLMAAVLVFELSGDYAIVLPLLLATGLATLVSERLRADSIYEAELRRRGYAWDVTLGGRLITQEPAAEQEE